MYSKIENLEGAADLGGSCVVGFGGTGFVAVLGGFTAPPAVIPID